jgi:DNA-binding XRE family transcriptional regulator
MTTLSEMIARLPEAERRKVEERAKELIAEELTRRDLRKARQQTQAHLAKELGVNQENVSRMEERSDLLLSTLSAYVEAMGGKLRLVAEFSGRPTFALKCVGALDEGELDMILPEGA